MAAYSMDPTQIADEKVYTSHDTVHTANIGERFPQAFWIGGENPANVTIVKLDDSEVVYPVATPGGWHPCSPFKGVKASGSPATVLVGITFRK